MAKNEALSLRAQWLGDRLRAARTAAGHTLAEAADYLGLKEPTLSRFELGTLRIRKSYVRDLVDFYSVRPADRAVLLQLNEDAWRKDWWDGDTDDLEMGFIDYTWLEARAAKISAYDPMLINGLLQTPEYARAVTVSGLGVDTPEETVDRMVDIRMTRQLILERDEPADLSVILEEAPLRRAIGDTNVRRDQLNHLLKLAKSHHVDIRVITADAGWHRGWAGPFTVFDLRDPYPDVVYIEGLVGRTFLEEQGKVDAYRRAYDELHRAALSASKTTEYIKQLLRDLE